MAGLQHAVLPFDVGGCLAGASAPQAKAFNADTALAELQSGLDHVPTPEEAKRLLMSPEPWRKIPVLA